MRPAGRAGRQTLRSGRGNDRRGGQRNGCRRSRKLRIRRELRRCASFGLPWRSVSRSAFFGLSLRAVAGLGAVGLMRSRSASASTSGSGSAPNSCSRSVAWTRACWMAPARSPAASSASIRCSVTRALKRSSAASRRHHSPALLASFLPPTPDSGAYVKTNLDCERPEKLIMLVRRDLRRLSLSLRLISASFRSYGGQAHLQEGAPCPMSRGSDACR